MERPDRANFQNDNDYHRAFEAYAVYLERFRDDPKQDARNKLILDGKIYVQQVDDNTIVVGMPQPLKCSIDISDASKYKIYFIPSKLKELYEAICEYYGCYHMVGNTEGVELVPKDVEACLRVAEVIDELLKSFVDVENQEGRSSDDAC